MNTWKVIQRKIYDALSHRYFLLALFPSLIVFLVLFTIVEAGEVWSLWKERDQVRRLVPSTGRTCSEDADIDVVYTWVNGSDPSLLKDLNLFREDSEDVERWKECPYPDCEPSHAVLYRGCDRLTRKLQDRLPSIQRIVEGPIFPKPTLSSHCKYDTSYLLYFSSIQEASRAVQVKKINGSLSQGFWTNDLTTPDSHATPEWIRLSGVVPKFLALPLETMRKMLSKQLHSAVLEIWPNAAHSFIILKLPSSQAVAQILHKSRILSLAGDVVVVSGVAMVFNTPLKSRFDHFAPSRFEDKEELRYSLRSLEKHAPWIRHIYLVTNGQIPHWLDLDNPRISLIPHDHIFQNKSHLPTFSSPAIEAHLHRIKGISNKFLYLNDDIMFTQDVWPEDFYTNSKGFKVYLSWPVPECNPSCLWSWVADGSCDAECNVLECGFDGGDCNETDNSPNSLKVRLPRDDFSIYDDMYDFMENAGGQFKDIKELNLFLEAPTVDLADDNSKNQEGGPVVPVNDDHLIQLREPMNDIAHLENVRRSKRAAVKKNLGSHTYLGSSRIAGKSADFPASVADSEFAVNQALLAAEKLRDAQRPRHRSPFPQTDFNDTFTLKPASRRATIIQESPVVEGLSLLNYGLPRKPQIHPVTNRFQTKRLVLNSSLVKSIKEAAAEFKKLDVNMESMINDSTIMGESHLLKNSHGRTYEVSNVTKERQHLQSLMENDLNESVDQTLTEKSNHGRTVYGKPKHRTLDSFAESLLRVNMLYNKVYGFETRRVPAHAPHLIEKHIMSELQEKFPKEWEETSAHKFRSPMDMQFAFSYFYFLMSEEVDVGIEELFETFDTDGSGTWSDREIRTLMTRLYPAPLNPHHLLQFEEIMLSCARNMPATTAAVLSVLTPMYERYQDSPLPTVTWDIVNNCPSLQKIMLHELGKKKKYTFEVVREWSKDVTFKMLHSNVSHLVGHLDDIRRNPKKFVCLNDNLDPNQESENAMVRAVLRDFYHSFFPLASKFELPSDMRNRFLHVSELEEWKESRAQLRVAAILAVVTLCLLTFAVICPDEIRHYGRRIFELGFCLQRRRLSRTRCKSRSPVCASSSSCGRSV